MIQIIKVLRKSCLIVFKKYYLFFAMSSKKFFWFNQGSLSLLEARSQIKKCSQIVFQSRPDPIKQISLLRLRVADLDYSDSLENIERHIKRDPNQCSVVYARL